MSNGNDATFTYMVNAVSQVAPAARRAFIAIRYVMGFDCQKEKLC